MNKKTGEVVERDKTMNLYQRILQVQSAEIWVAKEGAYNSGGTSYKYAKEADFVRAIRPLLADAGIIAHFTLLDNPEETQITSKAGTAGVFVRSFVQMALINVDNPSEQLVSRLRGDASDYGDKGIYKSYTGAKKYLLQLAFMVATGDDPEDDKVEEHSKIATRSRRAESEDTDTNAIDKRFEEHFNAIRTAPSEFEMEVVINDFKTAHKGRSFTSKQVEEIRVLIESRKAILKTAPKPPEEIVKGNAELAESLDPEPEDLLYFDGVMAFCEAVEKNDSLEQHAKLVHWWTLNSVRFGDVADKTTKPFLAKHMKRLTNA